MTRVCLDTDVLVAALASRGRCADLFRLVLTEHHLVVPELVAAELRHVLSEKLHVGEEALTSVDAVLQRCEMIPRATGPIPIPIPIPVRDPDDEKILADALSGGAEIFVTGDKALHAVAADSPIPILSPRGFMTLARGGTR